MSDYLGPLELGEFVAVLVAFAMVPLAREGEQGLESWVVEAPLERPQSVAVIAYLLIALAIIGLLVMVVTGFMIEFDARFLPILGAMGVAALFQVFLGFMLLQGHNGARWLYFIIAPLSFVIGLVFGRVSPAKLVQVVFYVIAVYYLTRPKAAAYFLPVTSRAPDV